MAGIAVLACAYVFSQFYRTFLAVLAPVLTSELGATKGDLSVASGIWFIAFALMQFAVGVSLDRYGPRRTVSLLFGIAATGGAVMFGLASGPLAIIIAMALIGIGCSPVLMGTLFLFARNSAPHRFAFLSSTFIAVGLAGNILGAAPLAQAAEAFGWRPVMLGLAAITFAIAVGIFFLVRDPVHDPASRGNGLRGYFDLLRIRELWPIIPLVFLVYSVVSGVRGLWIGPYLAEVYGMDSLAIGNVTLAVAVAMTLGTFAYGPLDVWFNTRKWIMVAGTSVVLAACVALAIQPAGSIAFATVMLVAIGLTGVGFPVMMTHARAYFPPHLVGRGVTLMNFFSIGGVGLMQWVTGALMESQEGAEPVTAYANLFWFYAGILVFALSIYLFSRDAKPEK